MKVNNGKLQRVLSGFIGLSSLIVLSACGQPPSENTSSVPTESSPAAEAPTTNAPVAEVPSTTSSPVAQAPTTTNENQNLVEVATNTQTFSTFTRAVEAAGLKDTLSGQQQYTVFAPTDQAFAALPAGTLEKLLQPENKEALKKVLTYHVVPGEVTSSQLQSGDVKTVEGNPLNVNVDTTTSTVKVNNASVITPDLQASNGVIHAVDQVILPPGIQTSLNSNQSTQ